MFVGAKMILWGNVSWSKCLEQIMRYGRWRLCGSRSVSCSRMGGVMSGQSAEKAGQCEGRRLRDYPIPVPSWAGPASSLKEAVQEMVRTARRIGLIKSPQVVICKKKKFLGSLNFFCEKFPIKHCSTHNMWIRWSFRSISSSYFHRNIMYIWIFAHPRLITYQLDWTRML